MIYGSKVLGSGCIVALYGTIRKNRGVKRRFKPDVHKYKHRATKRAGVVQNLQSVAIAVILT